MKDTVKIGGRVVLVKQCSVKFDDTGERRIKVREDLIEIQGDRDDAQEITAF